MNRELKFYCDMDDVLCDFDKQARDWIPDYDGWNTPVEHMVDFLNSCPVEFWSEMPWMPGGKEIWEKILPYKPVLLSALPRECDDPEKFLRAKERTIIGKKAWAEKHLGEEFAKTALIVKACDKASYAHNRDCILIDDRKDNISRWNLRGGRGILHDPSAPDMTHFVIDGVITLRTKSVYKSRIW